MTVIEAQQLTKSFATRQKQSGLQGSVRALFRPVRRETQTAKGITFTVEEGERVTFSVLVGSLAFWAVQWLLYPFIPAAFVGSVPAGLLSDFHWRRLAALVAFTTGIVLAARAVFQWGPRRYESSNLVTVRG